MKNLKDEPAIVAILAIALAVVALLAVSCGGGGSYSSPAPTAPAPTPTPTPTPTPAPSAANVTVNIVGSTGSGAFSPNPAAATVGQTVAFKNNDSTVHHIVSNTGGTFDSGDIAPGTTSKTMTVSSGSALNFHCTIHPTMVFAVNGASAPPDPTPNPSGGYDY